MNDPERAPARSRIHRHTLPADTETPISVFLKLRRGGTGFLLESAEQDGALGRFSFIGVTPDAVLRGGATGGTVTRESGTRAYQGPPERILRELAGGELPAEAEGGDVPALAGGLFGALGFDWGRLQEGLIEEGEEAGPLPLALFARYPTVVVFDHLRQALTIVSRSAEGADGERWAEARATQIVGALSRATSPPRFTPAGGHPVRVAGTPDEERFLAAVAGTREAIHDGEAIQVVLSRRFEVPFDADPFRLYRALRSLSPSPYMYYLEFPEVSLVGASPEMLLRVEEGVAQLSPIAGTRPRGSDADEDAANEEELRCDAKENAEHLMLVDLARNDLGRVCAPGSVHAPRFRQVERFSHVMHLVSTVTGRLAEGHDALSALAACFPAGTVSGAPRVQAMKMIAAMEPTPRGYYGGAVGYLGPGARALDSCIAIRTAVVRDGVAMVQAGAGIVADSDPQRELEEIDAKAAALLQALALAGASLPSPTTEHAA
jgi:anthranilate synthase component I